MNIPEGFVLVPVETQIEKSFDVVGGKHYPTIKITLPACHPDDSCAWNRRDSIGSMVGGILSCAPAYDEAKERELFEALTEKECPGADLRRCGKEEESYMNFYVAERWIGWKSCAKSRARSAE
ncbi:MAG: hypothetical protein [Bacteriophage sp.]|nr:MAG: hypothetical protein [Bacteriophage sp.]